MCDWHVYNKLLLTYLLGRLQSRRLQPLWCCCQLLASMWARQLASFVLCHFSYLLHDMIILQYLISTQLSTAVSNYWIAAALVSSPTWPVVYVVESWSLLTHSLLLARVVFHFSDIHISSELILNSVYNDSGILPTIWLAINLCFRILQ